ncbi:MAG: SLATT domain-containing protein [Candidatus Electrothrix sp. AR4]|nr:SLATT domain-containing protein [Candidatus Electrothrix sp. AR4]
MEESIQIKVLEDQMRECYGRVVWTHKTHEKCADILNARNSRIKLWQIILSAFTTSGVFLTVLGESKEAGVVAAVVSVMALALSTYVKKYNLGGMAQKHAAAAASIWDVRENYFSLLTDIRALVIDEEGIRKRRAKLQNDLYKIYKGSPRTISKAYDEASNALKNMEEMTFSDEEIDKFLPKSMRRSGK